jgi:DNA-binding transcriptional LysR family regulator
MIEGIELREVRIFLAVADELHFARAAEQVALTPSRVSQSVRSLESRIGGPLFVRTSRKVQLTPVGAKLRADLRAVCGELDAALTAAQDTIRGVRGTLQLGMLDPATYGGPHFSRIIEKFEQQHPACTVAVRVIDPGDQLAWLRSGQGDALVVRLPVCAPDIVVGPTLADEDRILAVSSTHPLAARECVDAEELADYVVPDCPAVPREMLDAFIPPLTPAGRTLTRWDVYRLTEVLPLVARGAVVHPTVRSFAEHYPYEGVTYVPITGLPRSITRLAWLDNKAGARIAAFASTAEQFLRSVAPAG